MNTDCTRLFANRVLFLGKFAIKWLLTQIIVHGAQKRIEIRIEYVVFSSLTNVLDGATICSTSRGGTYMTVCAFAHRNMDMCAFARIRLVEDAAQLAVSICVRLIGIVIRLRPFAT